MSTRYYLWGELVFPSAKALAAWENASVCARDYDWGDVFQGESSTARMTVDEIFDPLEEVFSYDGQECYFVDLDCDLTRLAVRGYLHDDDLGRILFAAFRCAGPLGATGTIYCEDALDPDYRLRLTIGDGTSTLRALGHDELLASSEILGEILAEVFRRVAAHQRGD